MRVELMKSPWTGLICTAGVQPSQKDIYPRMDRQPRPTPRINPIRFVHGLCASLHGQADFMVAKNKTMKPF